MDNSQIQEYKNQIKELKDALSESETKFNIFYNNSPDMYVAVSPKDATIKFCNQTLLKKTGYEEDEVVGMPVFNLYHEKSLAKVHEAFEEFVNTGKVVNKQLVMKTKSNTTIDVMLNVVSVRDDEGNIIYSTSSWRDITQELEAKQNEIEYKYLLDESQRMGKIGSWKINLSNDSFSCSDEIYNILQRKKEDKLQSYEELLKYVHKDDIKNLSKSYENFLEDKKPYTLSYCINIPNSTKKHILSSWEALFDDRNNILSIVGTIQDISYTKKIQKELEDLNKTLEEKVIEKTQKLEQTQDQLLFTEKMAALGSLVAGVAHEINTPIGIGLTGSTHFYDETIDLKEKYEKDLMTQEDFESYLDTSFEISRLINSNLERAAQLIKSFKQVAVDQSSEKKRLFNLSDYIDEVLISLNHIIKQKNIDFDIKCDKKLEIDTYPGALAQILTNLIINSYVHGFFEKNNGTISIYITINNEICNIIYKDTGIGIKQENIKNIFEPFYTTNRNNGSSGLGLNIIYNIIKKSFNGTITCKSEPNKGVRFDLKMKL